jgi:hypothetical protein
LIVIATTALAERCGGLRALARAMAKPGGADLEPTVRRWLALDRSKLKAIGELNRIVSRLARFSRTEIKNSRRRIRTESRSVGDRQAVLAYLSLLSGAEKPVVPTPEETLAFPLILLAAGLLAPIVRQIAEGLGTGEVHAQSAPSAASTGESGVQIGARTI